VLLLLPLPLLPLLLHSPSTMAPSDQLGLGSYRYFISIDFGTHGSGFAYSAAADGYEVKTFQYWPGMLMRREQHASRRWCSLSS
jgi:hypothetical protein